MVYRLKKQTLINRLTVKYMDTITQFEEIFYLLDYFTQETLQKLCLYHKEKEVSPVFEDNRNEGYREMKCLFVMNVLLTILLLRQHYYFQ